MKPLNQMLYKKSKNKIERNQLLKNLKKKIIIKDPNYKALNFTKK